MSSLVDRSECLWIPQSASPCFCPQVLSCFWTLYFGRETDNLPQKCLQSCLCGLYIVSIFWSHLYLDKEAAERLSKTVDEACLLLAEYNGRLAAELEDRRQLARMLVEYTQNQKDVLSEKEKKLEVSTLQSRPRLPGFLSFSP